MKTSHCINVFRKYSDGGLHKKYELTKESNKRLFTNVHKNTNSLKIKLINIPTDKIIDKLQMTLYCEHKINSIINKRCPSEGHKVLSVGYKHCTWIWRVQI